MALAKHAEEIQEKIWENEARTEEKWGIPTAFLFPYDEPDQDQPDGGDNR